MDRLQTFHAKELIHRDVKPDNYVIGLENKASTVYIVDYGLAKRYINSVTREHIPFSDQRRMVGTPRYCSLNSHNGFEQGRRDDLESLGYCLIYMLKGSLPWQGIRGTSKEERNLKVRELKVKLTLNELCKGLPKEVLQYMYIARNLGFNEKPPYSELHSLLSKVFVRNTCLKNFQYDWLAIKCKVKKNDRKNSEDSNKAEYEGVQKRPKRNMSRRLEIQNLASKTNLGGILAKQDEEVKALDKSRTMNVKPEKKVRIPDLKSSNHIQEVAYETEPKKTLLLKAVPTFPISEAKVSEDFNECDFRESGIAERLQETGKLSQT